MGHIDTGQDVGGTALLTSGERKGHLELDVACGTAGRWAKWPPYLKIFDASHCSKENSLSIQHPRALSRRNKIGSSI
jgi:hypothetical protein